MCLVTCPPSAYDLGCEDRRQQLSPSGNDDAAAGAVVLLSDDSSQESLDDCSDDGDEHERGESFRGSGNCGKVAAHPVYSRRWELLAAAAFAVFSVLLYPRAQAAAEQRCGDVVGASSASAHYLLHPVHDVRLSHGPLLGAAPLVNRDVDGAHLLPPMGRFGGASSRFESSLSSATLVPANDDDSSASLVKWEETRVESFGVGGFPGAVLRVAVRRVRRLFGRLLRWKRGGVVRGLLGRILGGGGRPGGALDNAASMGTTADDAAEEDYVAVLSALKEVGGAAVVDSSAEVRGKDELDSMREKWLEAANAEGHGFDEVVVESAFLPCTLDEFFHLFLSDDAPHSASDFLRQSGDTDVETTLWSPTSGAEADDGAAAVTRTIKYRHPVDAPMAPPVAGATKRQTLRRYGRHGLLLETRTIVDDVPMADVFDLNDVVWVEPGSDGEGVILTAAYRIAFVKRTMFRAIIAKNTGASMAGALRGYEAYARGALLGAN